MASPIQASDAWIRARDLYTQDLSDEEQQTFFTASPESLVDDASSAERNHGTNSTTRRVIEKLQPFVAAIEQYGHAVDVYSSTYSLALGPIWGSIKIAREFGKYFDKLVDMFARIGDVLPRFKTYERLFPNYDRLIQALSMAYLDIITFCTGAKAVFRRGQRSSKTTLKITLKLLWKPFDQQFGQQLSEFRQHQKNVEKEAGLAHMIESADARAMVLADQKQLEKRRREDTRLQILKMLNAVDYEAKHEKLQNLRCAGTGDWLFRQSSYVEWKTSSSSAFLCCRGIPGCGKSILASNLIDHLIGHPPTPVAPASDVVYYYCDYADQRTLHLDRILGSLLKQLFLNREIPEPVEIQLLEIYAGGTRSPAENALSTLLCSIIALHPGLHIILDGLGECDKRVWQAILKLLKRIEASEDSNVKIFITCVEEGPVSHHLANTACLHFSASSSAEDIKAFVTSEVRSKVEDGQLRIRNPKLEQEIISELITRANGMFLWVFFQLQDLCESSSDSMIRETLRNLPEGLGGTYKRILSRIGETPAKARLAQKIFQWATVAERPLHVAELKEAVAIEPDDKSWDEDKFPHDDLMLESCRGLIVKDEDDGTVRFAHHTVRQYLTGGLTTKVDPQFEVLVENAHSLAGQTCVAYLSFSDFETQLTSSTPTARLEQRSVLESGGPLWIPSVLGIRKPMFDIPYKMLGGDIAVRNSGSDYLKHLRPQPKARYNPSSDLKDKYRFLCYAIEHWEPHSRWYPDFSPKIHRRLGDLAMYKKLAFEFRPWGPNEHFGPYGCVGCPSPSAVNLVAKDLPLTSMIHYAAEVGNLTLLLISDNFTGADTRDYLHHERHHQETLLIACRHNRTIVIDYLLIHGYFDASDGKAVNTAADAGHTETLQCLFRHGQYSVKEKGHIALRSAAENGHKATVRAILEAGADPNAYDKDTIHDIIESAATKGKYLVVQVFSRTRAWRDFVVYIPRHSTTALHLAATNGHVAVTRALLESGLPIEKLNSEGQTALHLAAASGHSAVVELLFQKGATIMRDSARMTPVDLAAKRGHINVLESFKRLDSISPLSVVTSLSTHILGTTYLLHSAVDGRNEDVIRWLVKNGVDINSSDFSGETPLLRAAKLSNETAVRVLLELGASIAPDFLVTPKSNFYPQIRTFLTHAPSIPILKMILDNLRGDQRLTYATKRAAAFEALCYARDRKFTEATKLLEQESKLYC